MADITIGYLPTINGGWGNATNLLKDYPSDGSGKINTVVINLQVSPANNVKVGMFYGSFPTYQPRSFAVLGTIASTGNQNITGLDLAVELGDLIGLYTSTAYTLAYHRLSNGGYRFAGDATGGTNTYVNTTTQIYARGTGSTGGKKLNGITISKWNGVSISKLNKI